MPRKLELASSPAKPDLEPQAVVARNGEVELLRRIGERVREMRARRGMTQKALARDAGLSERYLGQLETGQGNVSILFLQRVAAALGMPLAELLRQEDERSVEEKLIRGFLERLPPKRLPDVIFRLMREFGTVESDRKKRIALIGLRGAGKSTLGQRLARELHVPFVELDREIEREAGTSLSEIFLLYGQAGYRRYEQRCLERVIQSYDRAVITGGGSIVSEPATYDLLLASCYTVWLRASPEDHMARVLAQGDLRPMEGSEEAMEDLRRILSGRALLYGKADLVVDTSGKPVDEAFQDLRKSLPAI
ncbi:MAG: helix-turn-helix transcriptional regulator [Rhodocyclales bacterium]|nr:helix-turn-helix transcriptional regulator [Rhodocyclales bacterium]